MTEENYKVLEQVTTILYPIGWLADVSFYILS